jgi:exosortase/archaeosortase family protein
MEKPSITSILQRYLLLLILGLGNLFIFYLILTPLTIYPVFFLINQFYDAVLLSGAQTQICEIFSNSLPFLQNILCIKTTIFFEDYYANIIPACIAGSAYYLLLILNLSTPMSISKRVKSLLFLLGLFLLLNIIRIFSFAMFFASKNYEIFNIAHVSSWYFGSTLLVILLWFSNIYLFKIKSIPVFTDIKTLINQIKQNK